MDGWVELKAAEEETKGSGSGERVQYKLAPLGGSRGERVQEKLPPLGGSRGGGGFVCVMVANTRSPSSS